jgi:broad specificity phosphatase PhoE
MKRALAVVLFLAGTAAPAFAQPAIFLVRHAERADTAGGASPMMATDPDLSEAGRARAESLATILAQAKITAIYTTEYKRTKQTAAPLAKALGLEPVAVPSKDVQGLVEKIKAAAGNVLVVGHSNSIPNVIKGLGVPEAVTVADDEYDHLFVVIRSAQPQLLRLNYR